MTRRRVGGTWPSKPHLGHNMSTRQELITELVEGGVKPGTATQRVTVAVRNLKAEIHPSYDKQHSNAVSYTDEDTEKIRAKLGLGAHTEPKPAGKSENTEVEHPGPKQTLVDTELSSQEDNSPPSGSVQQLAQEKGPTKQEQEKPKEPEPDPKAQQKAKKRLPWVWFAVGGLALLVTGWIIARRKRQSGGGEKGEESPSPSPSPTDLGEQYRMY